MDNAGKRSALVVASLVSFLIPFMGSSINVALPAIGKEFAMNAISLNWVASAYLLTAAVALVPCGRIADIYGRRMVFLRGMYLYTAGSLLCAIAMSGWALICFRVVQALGGAMVFGTSVAILTTVFPPNERGKALGINVAAVYLGLSGGPFCGGLLTYHGGWRVVFLANLPLCGLVIVVTWLRLKIDWEKLVETRFDIIGCLIYGVSLSVIMYGLSLIPTLHGLALLAAGFVFFWGFVRWELKVPAPLLEIRLFSGNSYFALSNLATFINYSATFAVGFLLSLYLQYVKGLTAQQTGMLLVCQPLVQALFSPLAGRMSDQLEPRLLASAGMGFACVSLFLLAFIEAGSNLATVIVPMILLGLGIALFSSPNVNAVMSCVDKDSYGVASAVSGTMRLVGMTFSMGVVMAVFAVHIGRAPIGPATCALFLSSARTAFMIFSCLCLVGVFVSLSRGKPQR